MWCIIIMSVYVVTVNGNIEQFTGEWTPVAIYPSVTYIQVCFRMSFAEDSDDEPCTCADGKTTQLLELSRVTDGQIVEEGKTMYPTLVVEDVNEVTGSLNVTCTCGDKVFPTRVVMKSVNNNYFVLYRPQGYSDKEPNIAVVYAKEVPTFEKVVNVVKSISDLSARSGAVICSSEFISRNLLLKEKLNHDEQLV